MAHMVRCIISQKYCRTAPILSLAIQDCTQLLEEDTHGLRIVVALTHRVINVTQSIEGDSEGDPGRQRLLGLRILLPNLAPGHPTVVSLVQPALVHVQDDLVLYILSEKCLCPGLALMDVEGGVDVKRLLPDPAVLHSEILLEHLDDESLSKR